MAMLLRQVISSGAPPSLARLPMTPEEVAASYGEGEDGTGNDPGTISPEPDAPGGGSRPGPPHPAVEQVHRTRAEDVSPGHAAGPPAPAAS
jgi:hypothetical protein